MKKQKVSEGIHDKKKDINTDKSNVEESMYLVEALDREKVLGDWEPEFITLYEKALLNSLWEKGILNQEEYGWCQEELNSRSEQ